MLHDGNSDGKNILTSTAQRSTLAPMPRASKTQVSNKTVRPVVAGKVSLASVAVAVPPTHEQIAVRAYALYEMEGRPHGRDAEHWARAEAELSLR
jgi:hypothetical protein